MIAALTITALLLIAGQAAVIARVIRRSELAAAAHAEALSCRSCGRLLRPGILSPYPRPCVCRERKRRYAL